MAISDNSYKIMAKSSGIIAFVQLFQMVFSLLRNKLVALFIGASGFGVWSLYHTLMDMATSFSTLGLDQGGVREIAKNSDRNEIAKCIFTFRVAISLISCVFCIILIIFSSQISAFIFKSTNYSNGIKLLSISVLFYGISKGGYAILNGLRDLKSLAISQILSSVIGSIGAILIVYFFKESGIPIALSIISITAAFITAVYVHRLKIGIVVPGFAEFKRHLKGLLFLGFGFTVAGLAATVMTMLSRSYLNEWYDLNAVGIYQASWTISNLYIGIILSAMGIDFMPRLSKVSNDNSQMNFLINQQMQFGMSLASIGVTLVLLFSPIILQILYSSEFISGVQIIRWQILGVILRILAFPFGYSIMAKGKAVQYAAIQIVMWVLDYVFLIVFSNLGGFDALGLNYFCAYVVYLTLTYCACRYNHGFVFDKETKRIIVQSLFFVVLFWVLCMLLDGIVLYASGLLLWIVQLYFTNGYIKRVMGIDIAKFLYKKILHR